ncbi:MAG: creatininase family protein [Candidatus Omnitrophica bacterium]|nr:creatininase family protein [Candidatus Omnitrophota bacterium]
MKKTVDGALAAAPLAVFANRAHSKEDESASSLEEGRPDGRREVRLEYLRPREIETAMSECAVLFQPLGTIEWHGYKNNVGVDALKAHRLCVLAAQKGGGLVAPPLYGGVGGLDEPHTFVIEPENEVHSVLVRPWIESLCREAVRQGFKAVIIVTGHYGAGQQIVVREAAVRMSRALGAPVLGTPEYMLALDADYTGDHAAWGETSLMMHLYPGSVDLSQLGEAPHKGVYGRDPKKYATREDGEKLTRVIVDRLAALSKRMPNWGEEERRRFIAAESALVDRQLEMMGETKNAWAAWRHIPKGVFAGYGGLLAEEKFEEIIAMVKDL